MSACHNPQNKRNLASWHLREDTDENGDPDVPEALLCQDTELGTIDRAVSEEFEKVRLYA